MRASPTGSVERRMRRPLSAAVVLVGALVACSSTRDEEAPPYNGECVPFEPHPGYRTCLLDRPQTRGEGATTATRSLAPRDTSLPLPPSVDLRSPCVQIRSQGKTGWCVAHAASSALELAACRAGRPTRASVPHLVYEGHARRDFDAKRVDTGWNVGDATALLQQKSLVLEERWPLVGDNENPVNADLMNKARPSATDLTCEASARADIVRPVPARDVEAIKGQLASGRGVVVAVPVHRELGWNKGSTRSLYGTVVDAPDVKTCDCKSCPTEPLCRDGWHAVLLVGYSDALAAFVFQNSWSTDFGDKGYGTVAYEVIRKYNDEARSIEGVGASAPPLECLGKRPGTIDLANEAICIRKVDKVTGEGTCQCGFYRCVDAPWAQNLTGCACRLESELPGTPPSAVPPLSTCDEKPLPTQRGTPRDGVCCTDTFVVNGGFRCRCQDGCEQLSMRRVPSCSPEPMAKTVLGEGEVIWDSERAVHTILSRRTLESWVEQGRARWTLRPLGAECDEPR